MEHKVIPEWLSLDIPKMEGRVLTLPTREDIDASLNEQLIVEYYSR
jgi:small subunit ribosomal protein S4